MPPGGATFDENSVPPWTKGDFRGVLERGPNPSRRLRDHCRCAPPLPRGSSRKLEGIHRLLGIDLSSGQIATFCPVFVSLLNLKPLQPIFVHFKLGLKTLAGSISQQMVEEANRFRISFIEIVSNAQGTY
jgi:hypothetical protein